MENLTAFSGTSKYYANFRPGIPKTVVDYLVTRYNLDGSGTLLDMGCGTGISTRAFEPYFDNVIAFDNNEEMLNEAIAADTMHKTDWRLSSDQNLDLEGNIIKVAIACRSFNWMNQYPLLQKLHGHLESGGVVAIIGDGSFWTGKEPWQKRVKEVIQEFLGVERKAGKGKKYNAPIEPYTITLEKNGYLNIDYKSILVKREWNISSIIGYLYSTSFSSKELYKGKHKEFEIMLNEELIKANNGNTIFIENAEFLIQSGIHQ